LCPRDARSVRRLSRYERDDRRLLDAGEAADGSRAQITITADDKPVDNSPTHTPGMEKRVTVPLHKSWITAASGATLASS
jgi:hypothetical protein